MRLRWQSVWSRRASRFLFHLTEVNNVAHRHSSFIRFDPSERSALLYFCPPVCALFHFIEQNQLSLRRQFQSRRVFIRGDSIAPSTNLAQTFVFLLTMFTSQIVRVVLLALLCNLALTQEQTQPDPIKCLGFRPTEVGTYAWWDFC